MNLIEAVKSGKPFRRKNKHQFWALNILEDAVKTVYENENYQTTFCSIDTEIGQIDLTKLDILADDWIIKED